MIYNTEQNYRQFTKFAVSILEALRSSSPTMYINGQVRCSICKNKMSFWRRVSLIDTKYNGY